MHQPLVLRLDEFLCGATGPTVAQWNVQHFDDYIADVDPTPIEEGRQLLGMGYVLAKSSNAALLIKDNAVVGYYMPPGAVCIHPDHKRRGLGRELILYTALYVSGGPPTAGLDEQCFSEAGWRAHIAAYHLGIARGFIEIPRVTTRPHA